MTRGACLFLLAVAACSSSPAMRAARAGDRAALAAAIDAGERGGTLSNAEAGRLAQAVAGRDVAMATGDDALARVAAAGGCARALDDALARRMEARDAAGALAALERLDAGTLDPGDGRDRVSDTDGAWRAMGARSLVRGTDGGARRRAFADPDPRVRRQAVRAAGTAADGGDLEALLDVARSDPEPRVRMEAVRSIGELRTEGAAAVVSALVDLWPRADDGLREDIAIAWSGQSLWNAGGLEALRLRVASGSGAGATEGALAILRRGGADADVERSALERVRRAIDEGPRARRLQAIAGAPIARPELREALTRASTDADTEVRVGALERLAEARAPGALDALEQLATPGAPSSAHARFALAILGDRRVQAWVEGDLTSTDTSTRLGSAESLAALGVEARAARLLADEDATVRIRAACAILEALRRR